MLKNIFCLGFFLMMILSACYRDKGNYDYETPNDVAVKLADTIKVVQGQQLKITPDLIQRLSANESHLTFEWSLLLPGRNTADSTYKILATTRNLDVSTTNLQASSSYYPLYYKIKDNETGITYRKLAHLQITTNYQFGWIVLEQNGNSGDLDFINLDQKKAYYKLFSTANPGITLPSSTNFLFNYNNPQTTTAFTAVLFANDGYVVDNGNFKIQANISSLFSTKPAIIKPQFMHQNLSNNLTLINDGKLYYMYAGTGETQFADVFTAPDGLGYSLAPQAYKTYAGSGIFFDQQNYRFVREGYNTATFTTIDGYSSPFDPNQIQKKLLSMKSGYNNNISAVFKNESDDDCFLYGLNNWAQPSFVTTFDSSLEIYKSPDFLFPSQRNQMYFAVDNQLYLYDIINNTALVAYTFPAGENVTALENQDNVGIAVSTFNGSAGKVYLFTLESTGDVTKTGEYSGFGKVIKMSYRN